MKNHIDERFFELDSYGAMRIPGVMWLALLVHTRHWVLLMAALVSGIFGTSVGFAFGEHSPVLLMLQLPALFLVLSAIRREPGAGYLMRAIWRNGRWIFAVGAILSVGWTAWYLLQLDFFQRWPDLYFISACLLDVATATWAFTSKLPVKVFSEFPCHTKGT